MSMLRPPTAQPVWPLLGVVMAITLLMGIVVSKAFVLEDAFIVMRSVQNFHLGFDFSALPDVRSQSFTSNLWTLLLLLGGYVSNDLPNVAVMISLGCTLIAALIMTAYFFRRGKPGLAVLGVVMLAACNSFTDYSTGGLENPLSHVLLSLFIAYVFSRSWKQADFFVVNFLAALLTANRYDQVLLVLPLLALGFVLRRDYVRDACLAILGFAPLWLWMAFAWFYYGSAFPDTYFAKMATGVPVFERMNFAFLHHLRMMDLDFFGMAVMLAVMAAGVWQAGVALLRKKTLFAKPLDDMRLGLLALAGGIFLYNVYFFYAGGDFMAGRFMSVAMLVAVWAVVIGLDYINATRTAMLLVIVGALALCGIKQQAPHVFVPGHGAGPDSGYVRAQTFDYRLFAQNWYFLTQDHKKKDWRYEGWERAVAADGKPYPSTEVHVAAGIIPYYAGPRHIIIDRLGLSDPLLSRLPCSMLGAAAHCLRNAPAGYAEFIATHDASAMDPDLAAYAVPLFKIKTLPLFSGERIGLLLRFTAGEFNAARKAYIDKHRAEFYKPGDGQPLFRLIYNQTVLAPWLGDPEQSAAANILNW